MLLGAIQGATEFLPVSSSGHLALGQMILIRSGLEHVLSNQPLMLEILLHLATFLAVVVFFRRDVAEALKGVGRGTKGVLKGELKNLAKKDNSVNLAVAVIIGSVPTAVIGLMMRDAAQRILSSPVSLGFCFLGSMCLLLASRWWQGGFNRLTWRTALVIGIVQGLAVLPGISRSGITIVTGLALGLQQGQAIRFSFLLSLPAVIGAAALELSINELAADMNNNAYLLGGLVAFVVGLFALFVLDRLVRRGQLWVFAPYVGLAGLGSIFSVYLLD